MKEVKEIEQTQNDSLCTERRILGMLTIYNIIIFISCKGGGYIVKQIGTWSEPNTACFTCVNFLCCPKLWSPFMGSVEIYKYARTQEKCLEKPKPGTIVSHTVLW